MKRKRCQAEAPSTRAASNGSTAARQARPCEISATIGVHIQASTRTSVGTTQTGSESQSGGEATPIARNRKRMMPSVGSSITTQTRPIAAGVATIGRISKARSRLRPKNRQSNSNAIPRPAGMLEATPSKVNKSVRQRELVKRWSPTQRREIVQPDEAWRRETNHRPAMQAHEAEIEQRKPHHQPPSRQGRAATAERRQLWRRRELGRAIRVAGVARSAIQDLRHLLLHVFAASLASPPCSAATIA